MAQHCGNRRLLIGTQLADERDLQRLTTVTLITQFAADVVVSQQFLRSIQAAARQGNVPRIGFGIADYAGFVPDRHPHRLCPVELRVLERGKANQAVGQRLRQLRLFEVDEIAQRHSEWLRHYPRQLLRRRGRTLPRRSQVFFVDESDIQCMRPARGTQDARLNVVRCHRMDGRQECPLVVVGMQFRINENAAAVLTRHLLQG